MTLTNDNTYTGSTTISSGTLQLGDGGTSGSIASLNIRDDASLVINRSDAVTYAGVITGTGSLTKSGAGALVLSNDSTYTGGTTISAGTLQLGVGETTGSILGNIKENSILYFNRDNTLTYAGVVSGNGALVNLGAGTLVFTNSNLYAGGTTIAAGTIQLGAGGTSGSIASLTIADNGSVAFNHSDSISYTGTISGTGSLSNLGSGTLTLTGNNTYTGGTTISAGALQIGNGGTTGSLTSPSIADGTAVVFNRSDSLTYSGNISGAGSFQKSGAGTLVASGTNSYTGVTNVSAGTLRLLNNSLVGSGGAITIAASATLQAAGDIQRIVAGGGTLAATGDLLIGDFTSPSGFSFAGSFSAGATTTLFLSAGVAHLAGAVHLGAGADLNSLHGLQFDSTAVVTAGGAFTVDGPFTNLGSINTPGLIVTNSFTQSSSNPASVGALTGPGAATVAAGMSLSASTVSLAALTLQSGATTTLAPGGTTSTLSSLSLLAGAKLDLNNDKLVINYTGASPAAAVRAALISGFNSGNWNGAGIDSSTVHADATFLTALGYRDNGANVTVKYTYYGDSNLDGVVNATDFQMFLDGLVATSGSSWSQGDYTYDGKVDLGNDFNLFLVSYLKQGNALGDLAAVIDSNTLLSNAQKSQLHFLVPEPAAATSFGLAATLMAARRRRRQK